MIKKMKPYFPQGIATQAAFCNRNQERAEIKASIEHHEHLVITAPRGYGKSSLIAKVLAENDFPSVCIDLFFVLTQAQVAHVIIEHLSKLINTLLPKKKSLSESLIKTIAALNPTFTFRFLGQKLEITPIQTHDKTISELLLMLDHLCQQTHHRAVVVFDEFQQIGTLKENHAIEAIIRHAVERSQAVSYIFCGSKRHLLNDMFSDKSRPLYHLCDLMSVERIATSHYQPFLTKMAKQQWQIALDQDIIHEILLLTQNHPYYVNALCRKLWRNEQPITLADVKKTWHRYVQQQSTWIMNDLGHLTLNRRKVLTALAQAPTCEPQGQPFSMRTAMGASAISKTIQDLDKLDLIYQDQAGYYHVLDPAVAYFIGQQLP